MRIFGIEATEANLFHPDQWVNVWSLLDGCEFYCSCQVRDLDDLLREDEPSDFGLEPTDEDGGAIAVNVALERGEDYRLEQMWAEALTLLGAELK